jgi:hypothetical protein
MAAIIMDFGKGNDGANLFRINGTKAEIEKAIQDIKDLGCELFNVPYEFEKAHKQWSVLVKFFIPEELNKGEQNADYSEVQKE